MSTQSLKIMMILMLLAGLLLPAYGQRIEKERIEFKELLLQNANYFGTFPEFELAPVSPIQLNTRYEAITCLGFYPEQNLLEAIVDVKLPYGYNGNLCTSGSYEYVRFYADWNKDGDFADAGEDLGISAVNVHNIPNAVQPCLDSFKPLSYALPLNVNSPMITHCSSPFLVKVRAILSWELPPTAGNPNFIPVWGNVVEKWIQIESFKLHLKDVLHFGKLNEIQIDTSMLDLDLPVSKPIALSAKELQQLYKDKDVAELRYNLPAIYQQALAIKQNPLLLAPYKLDPQYKKLVENLNIVLAGKPSTQYEQLRCVGLSYDQDQLVATLTVKQPYGYSGDLCTNGSYEYVAFWAYVHDQIEQQCVWSYLGTASVNVHDIKTIQSDGLQYAVYLPANFSNYWDKCSNPKILKVRAILSWNVPPSTTNPHFNPVWGNKVDALIQLKPREPVQPGVYRPFIWALGEMAVESISGNPFTTLSSTLGNGYANGVSVGGGFTAIESPFGGVIKISGSISNAPDISEGAVPVKYKVQFRKSTEVSWHDINNNFLIWSRINSVPSGSMWQVVDFEGYYSYQKDLIGPNIIEVQDDVIAQWHTESLGDDGLYEIRMLVKDLTAPPIAGVPTGHRASEVIKAMIDNTAPKAVISLDAGPCTKFEVGDTFTGKFTATDKHIYYYKLTVEPTSGINPPTIAAPVGETYPGGELFTGLPALPATHLTGRTNQSYTVTTTSGTTPCGYVIRLSVRDRSIKNNSFPGHWNSATVGLCLLEKE